jgi:hypothetical protein
MIEGSKEKREERQNTKKDQRAYPPKFETPL